MNRIDEIKDDLKFHNTTSESNVLYLLSIIEQAEKALNNIVNFDDGIIRIHEEMAELADVYENIAKVALKAIRGI